jgi:hypothetical protein
MLAAAARAELAFYCYARGSSPEGAEVTGPAWVAVGFAALMLLITACSAGRLTMGRLSGRGAESDADALHLFMGMAMAGMFEPRLSLVPGAAWLPVFTAGAAWFAWQAIRARRQGRSGGLWHAHPAPHAVECAAMIYVLLPAGHGPGTTMPGMGGPGSAGNPAIALVLALFMLGYVLWTTDRLAVMSRARAAASGAILTPRLAACYKIAMSVGMGYMLLAML